MNARTSLLVLVLMVCAVIGAEAADPIGLVIGLQGNVTAVNDAGESRALKLRSDIYLKDKIRTAKDSKVQVMFEDDTVFAQGEDSEIVIDEYIYSPDKKEDNGFLARLSKGVYRIITGKITELNPDRFKVKTGRATIGIRGCETGIDSGDISDLIMALDLGPGDNIHVASVAAEVSRIIRQSGFGVLIDNRGRLSQVTLDMGRIRSIMFDTNPGAVFARLESDRRGLAGPQEGAAAGKQSGDGGFSDAKGAGAGAAGDPTTPSGTPPPGTDTPDGSRPPVGTEPGTGTGMPRDPLDPTGGVSPQTDDGERDLVLGLGANDPDLGLGSGTGPDGPLDPINEFSLELAMSELGPNDPSTVLQGGLVLPLPLPGPDNAPPPENAPPGLILSGGGIGATYVVNGSPPPNLLIDHSVAYHRIEGAFGPNMFDGHAYGRMIDTAGDPIGNIDFPLSVPLSQFGPLDTYVGTMEVNIGGGVMVMNDNLQQFVTIEDPANDDRTLLYFGYESRSYPNAQLDRGVIHYYDIKLLEHPPKWDAPGDPTIPQDVVMTVNPQTGGFYIPGGPNNLPVIGNTIGLTFYGEASQGVAGQKKDGAGSTLGDGVSASGLAGFLQPGVNSPRPTGQSTHNGYAMAIGWPDAAFPAESPKLFNSPDFNSGTASGNEGQLQVGINRDATYGGVDFRLNAYQDAGSPATTDIRLGLPDEGNYVTETSTGSDIYGVNYHGNQSHFEVYTVGGGQDWNVLKWMGERQVDYGTGLQVEHVEGEAVEGNVVDAFDFANLVAGATSYALSSPTPGWAAADVVNDNNAFHMDGTCNMFVNVPGGGSQPTWGGTFAMTGDGGESLSMNIGLQDIDPASGRLELNNAITSFTMDNGGFVFNGANIQGQRGTGNVVGQGGLITGIIGDMELDMDDPLNTVAAILFGSDLN